MSLSRWESRASPEAPPCSTPAEAPHTCTHSSSTAYTLVRTVLREERRAAVRGRRRPGPPQGPGPTLSCLCPPSRSPVRPLLAWREGIPTKVPGIEDLGKQAADEGPKAQETASTPGGEDRTVTSRPSTSSSLHYTPPPPTHARMSAESRSKASRWMEGRSSSRRGPSPSKLCGKHGRSEGGGGKGNTETHGPRDTCTQEGTVPTPSWPNQTDAVL